MKHLVKNDLYFLDHPAEFDAQTDEQMQNFLAGKFETVEQEADTRTEAEKAADLEKSDAADAQSIKDLASGKKEEPAADDDATKKAAAEAAKKAAAGEEPVIIAKDGKSTIPFAELEKSRQLAKDNGEAAAKWEKLATENATAMETLKTDLEKAKEIDAEAGTSEAQDKILADFKEDYGEIHEAVMALVGTEVGGKLAEMQETINSLTAKVEPIEASSAETANLAHFNGVLDAHPDFEAIIESGDLNGWIEKQPSFLQKSYMEVTKTGSTSEVVELFQTFKDANPEKYPAGTEGDEAAKKAAAEIAKKAAAEKLKGTEAEPPASLSDAAGSAVHHDEGDAMKAMSGQALVGKFAGKDIAQIEKMMSNAL